MNENTDNILKLEHVQKILRGVVGTNPEATAHYREEVAALMQEVADQRLHLLLEVLQHTRHNQPDYFTEGEHFSCHRERAAWFQVREAAETALHNQSLVNPRLNVENIEDIAPAYRISEALEKKVRHIAEWIRLANND